MPRSKSKRPGVVYAGNKFLITSAEAKELRAAMGIFAHQIGQLLGYINQLKDRIEVLENPKAIKIAQPGDVPDYPVGDAGIMT